MEAEAEGGGSDDGRACHGGAIKDVGRSTRPRKRTMGHDELGIGVKVGAGAPATSEGKSSSMILRLF